MDVVVRPRFGDSAQVATDAAGRPKLVMDVGTGTLVIDLDGEPGSVELAACFADTLADAALAFAARCRELMGSKATTLS
ncbi:hypothetical protein [Saccharothrix australiensis]|uniref:Uncharacterized protein n=1 Tax=Saccharothrix australiensis TaxID=2072 RepID=A0A495VWV2_9PSEU|nr:hypothetical protein [Saccharothrix australiensis]RKT53063.1 hypothetical protein C8E97_1611 [Saccharothrix australiensis]